MTLRERDVRLILLRDAGARAAFDASPRAELVRAWSDWALYRIRPGVARSGR
jgi:hypothetical protein